MFRKNRNSEAGFTLVEVAIVMVIIGLLIGGILKGQEMIKNGKIKRVMKQADELRAAVTSYQDRYGLLPGDDNAAVARGWAVVNGNGNGQINGGNGIAQESLGLFQHLAAAGLLSGNFTASAPKNPFGGLFFVQWALVQGRQINWFYTLAIPGDVAAILDTSYDDGLFNSGSIRSVAAYDPNVSATLYIEF